MLKVKYEKQEDGTTKAIGLIDQKALEELFTKQLVKDGFAGVIVSPVEVPVAKFERTGIKDPVKFFKSNPQAMADYDNIVWLTPKAKKADAQFWAVETVETLNLNSAWYQAKIDTAERTLLDPNLAEEVKTKLTAEVASNKAQQEKITKKIEKLQTQSKSKSKK